MNTTEQELLVKLNNEFTLAVLPVTVFVGIEATFGLFGNLLVLYVFLCHYHECNFKYFVLCLAFTDVTSSLTTIPGEMVTQLFWYNYPVPMVCKVKSFFNVFTVSSETFCLLTIAIDRYLKVCRPLSRQIKPRVAMALCFVIFTLATIMAVPVAVFWGTHSYNKTYEGHGLTVTVCEKDETYIDTGKPIAYSLSIQTIISICLTCMFILYVFVAKKLFSGKRQSNGSKTSNIPFSPSDITIHTDECSGEKGLSDFDYSTNPEIDSEQRESSSNTLDNCPAANTNRNTLTVPKLKKHNNNSKQHNGTHSVPKTATAKKLRVTTRNDVSARVRRKTLIMFILTVVFIVTTVLYLTLLSLIAKPEFLQNLSDGQKALYFFFFRLYFINHVINPIVYGLLDPQFRKVMKNLRQKMCLCK